MDKPGNALQRREFLRNTLMSAAAVSIGGILPGVSAKSYGNIIGANDRVRLASMGVNARGLAVAENFAGQPNCEVLFVCDVDSRAADKCISSVGKIQKTLPLAQPDFRKALESKDL